MIILISRSDWGRCCATRARHAARALEPERLRIRLRAALATSTSSRDPRSCSARRSAPCKPTPAADARLRTIAGFIMARSPQAPPLSRDLSSGVLMWPPTDDGSQTARGRPAQCHKSTWRTHSDRCGAWAAGRRPACCGWLGRRRAAWCTSTGLSACVFCLAGTQQVPHACSRLRAAGDRGALPSESVWTGSAAACGGARAALRRPVSWRCPGGRHIRNSQIAATWRHMICHDGPPDTVQCMNVGPPRASTRRCRAAPAPPLRPHPTPPPRSPIGRLSSGAHAK